MGTPCISPLVPCPLVPEPSWPKGSLRLPGLSLSVCLGLLSEQNWRLPAEKPLPPSPLLALSPGLV